MLKITPNPDPLEGSAVLEWTIKAPAVGEMCLAGKARGGSFWMRGKKE